MKEAQREFPTYPLDCDKAPFMYGIHNYGLLCGYRDFGVDLT